MILLDFFTAKIGTEAAQSKLLPALTSQQKELMWSSPVFMYPELLPSYGYLQYPALKKHQQLRVCFTESEDK